MEDSKEKSLKVINESLFDRIKRFVLRLFKKEEKINQETNIEAEQTGKVTIPTKTEEEAQQDLIRRIESEEIKQEDPKDEELEKIKEDLSRYLDKIQKEIGKDITEESA